MGEVLGLIVAVLSAVTLAGGLVGAAVKFALLPWLRTHLVEPVQETRHQVTANSHASPVPTVPDRLEDIAGEVRDLATEVRVIAAVFDQHIDWSSQEAGRLWQALRNRKAPPHE